MLYLHTDKMGLTFVNIKTKSKVYNHSLTRVSCYKLIS